ncbi:ADP-ribosylglycohydrolase family protein [Steroidobacter denitrificans]|nr:ADP-ribosylglycohydrolase family protein [Steroidobacter denitrificans]
MPSPLPNSYWVQPGRLLAGEYPGSMSRADAMERVQQLLRAGINSFLDLTEEGELPAYDCLLPGLTEQQVRYRRIPIVDHDLPESDEYMSRILDRIDAEIAADRNVYVHCHAGIGRTGMTVACHLIRRGLDNEEALERLQHLWRQCVRSHRWPTVPETPEQVEFVRRWHDTSGSEAESAGLGVRYQGALVGLAVGDALGTLVAVSNYNAAAVMATMRDAQPLATSIHTATTVAAAQSLLASGGHDPQDQLQRYLQWFRDAEAPADFKRALAVWQWSRKPHAGSHDPNNLDPHSLPRTLAAVMFRHRDATLAIDLAADLSRTTQQSPVVLDLCRFWAGMLIDALAGVDRNTLLAYEGPATQLARRRPLKAVIEACLAENRDAAGNADDKHCQSKRQNRDGSDTQSAVLVTRMAIQAFASGMSFREAMIELTTRLRAPSAAAALCGALAGAHYGIEAIPAEWRRRLLEDAVLRSIARHLSNLQ